MSELNWDYNGWRNEDPKNPYTQKDWNQTLITKVNQLSAQIYQKTLSGGANTITMNSKIYNIIETFVYTDITNQTVGGRYKIVIDDSLPDIIKVSREGYSMTPITHDFFSGPTMVSIHQDSPELEEYKNREDITLKIITPEMLCGQVTILNYD